jgi:hypothetical protein
LKDSVYHAPDVLKSTVFGLPLSVMGAEPILVWLSPFISSRITVVVPVNSAFQPFRDQLSR